MELDDDMIRRARTRYTLSGRFHKIFEENPAEKGEQPNNGWRLETERVRVG